MPDAVNAEELRAFVERIERLEEERKAIGTDIKDIYDETKGKGYEPKLIKKCIALRKLDPEKRRLDDTELEVYKDALGID